jgi:hypothetical protein
MKGVRTIDILVRQTAAINRGDLDEMERWEHQLEQKEEKKFRVLNKHTMAPRAARHKR